MGQKRAAQFQVTVAGVGGQGVVLLGRLLVEAGKAKYKRVSYFPRYDSIMRGGQSECTVILSEEEISSPITLEPQAAIVMHPQFLEQYQKRVVSGGVLLLDSTIVQGKITRKDLKVFHIPATESAVEFGDRRAANLILLGAYLEATKALPLELVEETLASLLRGRGEALLALNIEALKQGARLAASYSKKRRKHG